MTALPLSIDGAFGALRVANQPLIAVCADPAPIVLMGIAFTKNSILLADFAIEQNPPTGMDRNAAFQWKPA